MSQTRSILDRVDGFFEAVPDKDSPAVGEFVKNLYESYCHAEKAVQRQLFLVATAWVIFYAVAQGIVSEAEIASFKISNIRYIAIIGPPVIGFLSYTLASAAFLSLNLGAAFWQCIKHILPQAYDQDLEQLLGPPTFIRAERMTKTGEHALHRIAAYVAAFFFVAFSIFGTFIAVTHVSYLTWLLDPIPRFVRVIAIMIGLVAWLRAMLLWVRNAAF